jgi:hypothetical protein
MSRRTLRVLLTILMYAGVGVFLYPYFSGHLYSEILILILGAAITVSCGLCRCFLTPGDCRDQHISKPAP